MSFCGAELTPSNIINDQRRRALALHSAITELQLTRSNIPSDPESDDDTTHPGDPNPNLQGHPEPSDPRDATASVLRNRLFGQHREGLLGHREGLLGHRGEESSEHVLSHHRMLQDEIAEEMVGMARGLRDRSVAFGEALREDSKVYPALAHTPSRPPSLIHSLVCLFPCSFVCLFFSSSPPVSLPVHLVYTPLTVSSSKPPRNNYPKTKTK